MKNLSIIACVSQDLGLGVDNYLLWQIKPDMQFFRETTLNHPVIMGSKTFQSIGRPLPKRENIVLTRNEIENPDVKVFHSQPELDSYLKTLDGEKFIIGGASLYAMYLDLADKLYLTEVAATKPADTYFPTFDKSKYDRKVLKADTYEGIRFEIVEYTRKARDSDQDHTTKPNSAAQNLDADTDQEGQNS